MSIQILQTTFSREKKERKKEIQSVHQSFYSEINYGNCYLYFIYHRLFSLLFKLKILTKLSESQSQRNNLPFPPPLSVIYTGHRIAHQVNLHSGEQIDGLQYYV